MKKTLAAVATAAVALVAMAAPAQARVLDTSLPVQACQDRAVTWGAYSPDPVARKEITELVSAELKKVSEASEGRYTFRHLPGAQAWNHQPGADTEVSRIGLTRYTKGVMMMFVLAPQAPEPVDEQHLTVENPRIAVTRQDEARMSADGQGVWLNYGNLVTVSQGMWEGKNSLLAGKASTSVRALNRERSAGILDAILRSLGIERVRSSVVNLTPAEIREIRAQAQHSCELVAAHPDLGIYSPIDSDGNVGTDAEAPFE